MRMKYVLDIHIFYQDIINTKSKKKKKAGEMTKVHNPTVTISCMEKME